MSKGIDKPIDACVLNLLAKLYPSNTRQFLGRVFREQSNGKIKPIYYTSSDQYIDCLKNDSIDAQCFFDLQPITKFNSSVLECEIWSLWMLNLTALYPTLTRTEATEQAQYDIGRLLDHPSFEITRIVRDFEGFKGYDFSDINVSSFSPHYLLRFDLKLFYSNNNC